MAFGGYDGVVARVAALYRERLEATGVAPTISAPTNGDAPRIGEAVRAQRRDMGPARPGYLAGNRWRAGFHAAPGGRRSAACRMSYGR